MRNEAGVVGVRNGSISERPKPGFGRRARDPKGLEARRAMSASYCFADSRSINLTGRDVPTSEKSTLANRGLNQLSTILPWAT
jgi:hypothetical protein